MSGGRWGRLGLTFLSTVRILPLDSTWLAETRNPNSNTSPCIESGFHCLFWSKKCEVRQSIPSFGPGKPQQIGRMNLGLG